MAFDQVKELFREILGVVAGPLQRLRDEENAYYVRAVALPFQMTLKQGLPQLVKLAIHAEHLACQLQISRCKTFMDFFQHFLQNHGHVCHVLSICPRQMLQHLDALGHVVDEVSDAFEVGINLRHAKSSRALSSDTCVMAWGSLSSICLSIWSSSFSQSLTASAAIAERFLIRSPML